VCPVAVAFVIFAMKIIRIVYPPCGANSLLAVAGGDKIMSLVFYIFF
tara:strand:+ start:792 stop:932 length:141 start_codon:yes stop_codon:yes gene_type:complete